MNPIFSYARQRDMASGAFWGHDDLGPGGLLIYLGLSISSTSQI